MVPVRALPGQEFASGFGQPPLVNGNGEAEPTGG